MFNHTNKVLAVAIDKNTNSLASGGLDLNLKLWNTNSSTLAPLQNINSTHRSQIECLAFGDQVLATGSADRSIKIWASATGALLTTLTGHAGGVLEVAFGRSNLLASGSDDRTVRLWDIVAGSCVKTLTGHTATVWAVAFYNYGLF